MLAQNFLPHDALGLTEAGRDALVAVLGMLERDDLVYVDPIAAPAVSNGFNMRSLRKTNKCGTVCCIAGWALVICGHHPVEHEHFVSRTPQSSAWDKLIMPRRYQDGTITVPQAARALRSYLTTGEPNWEEERC